LLDAPALTDCPPAKSGNPQAVTSSDSTSSATHRSDGYAPLRSYAAIGDGRAIALIARDGRVDWLPLPDVTATPVFAALLDAEHGGYLSLAPDEPFTVERTYVEGTNVLSTTMTTAHGSVVVTDSLNTGVAGRLPWIEFARRIEGVDGTVAMTAHAVPGTCLNRCAPYVQQTSRGAVLRVDDLTMAVRTINERAIDVEDQSISVHFDCRAGSRHLFALVATESEPLFLPDPQDIDDGIDRTVDNWHSWNATFTYDGPWSENVHRAALALKLLIHSPTGAMLAAATTSLPESLTGGKNWDYRFAWTRDSAYALTALLRFGLKEETHAAISWLMATTRRASERPHVLYDLHGVQPSPLVERDVPGWNGIGPVVEGNDAADQLQLGVFGDLFSIITLYVDQGNVLDARTARSLTEIADVTCDLWRAQDSGMWELPEARHYVTSKMGCWQALTDAVHLAELGQIPGDPGRWRSEAERIRQWIDDHGWSDEKQAYIWYPGTDQLDTSVLLHAISGYDRGPRMSSTIDAIIAELGEGPWLYRFSGARKEEAAFVASAFWLVSALVLIGRRDEAAALMTRLVDELDGTYILAEMIVPSTGEFLGNLPQALSHLALLNAAITLAD
jgi:GH15 family glucan-1,4-alpha-glucosidase